MKIKFLLSFILGIASIVIFAIQTSSRLRHVVCFKFKSDAIETRIKALIAAFEKLETQIEHVKDLEWGVNNIPQGLDKSMTHIFQITFKNEKDRDAYLAHAANQDFIEEHTGVVVVDYLIQ